jgi:hypothetical protein
MTDEQIWQCNSDGVGGFHICVAHQNVLEFARSVERESANNERQFIIKFLESMHERCLGTHNYYLHAANLVRELPPTKST